MVRLLLVLVRVFLATAVRSRSDLVLENLALRQQLATLRHERRQPKLTDADRQLWVWLRRTWPRWRELLHIVKPETVVRWHRNGFRYWWRWRSKPRQQGTAREMRKLIRQMAMANPTWGAPRIHGELERLGFVIGERTVSRLMPKRRERPPTGSQRWMTFLRNHAADIVSLDMFTVPTVSFRILYVLVLMDNERRRILHVNVTEHPTQEWTSLQLVQAFPEETAPRFLLRDRDNAFGPLFRRRARNLAIHELLTTPQSPWQNPYVERFIGSVRRECLDHVVVLGERHLCRLMRDYIRYYNRYRTHLALDKDAPEGRAVQPIDAGEVVAIPQVGGLHHRYERRAA